MIRFGIVGSGYRSLFYVRVAKALPERFEMVGMLCRTREKADRIAKEYDINTVITEEEFKALNPDFIVSAVSKVNMSDVVRHWAALGYAVLSETPAALDIDTLKVMHREVAAGARIQVAEQYFLYPSIRGLIDTVRSGIIGKPVTVHISMMHDYHAASVIRELLGTELRDVNITGKCFDTEVTDTRTRYEILTEGKIVTKQEGHYIFEYEDKTAFYDFMSDQYRSPIRHKSINIRGTRGEIIGDEVYYLNESNREEKYTLQVNNPFEQMGLNEDEAAIAELLIRMESYAQGGSEIYPYVYAEYDALIAIAMQKAGKDPYKTVKCSISSLK